MGTPRSALPPELQDVATSEDLNTLGSKVDRCYSADRYEEFQEAVEKIIWRALETETAHTKLRTKIQAEIKKYLEDKGWKNKTFWIPTLIALIGAIVAVAAFLGNR